VQSPPNIAAASQGPTYPSGHGTFGAEVAILLSMMVPEKRSELFARGWQYGEQRIEVRSPPTLRVTLVRFLPSSTRIADSICCHEGFGTSSASSADLSQISVERDFTRIVSDIVPVCNKPLQSSSQNQLQHRWIRDARHQ
jgi:hypothetical protein